MAFSRGHNVYHMVLNVTRNLPPRHDSQVVFPELFRGACAGGGGSYSHDKWAGISALDGASNWWCGERNDWISSGLGDLEYVQQMALHVVWTRLAKASGGK